MPSRPPAAREISVESSRQQAMADRIEHRVLALRREPGSIALDPRPPRLRDRGWDNEMWEVGALADGTTVVLRLPTRDVARPLLAREVQALRALENLPIRAPRLLAELDTTDPLGPALLVTWIEGDLLAERVAGTDPDDPAVREHARSLARALGALHCPVGADHPRSPVRGVPLTDIAPRLSADLDDLPVDLRTRRGPAVRDVLASTVAAGLAAPPWTGPDLFLHGDPHPGNLLVVPAGLGPGEKLALLDWGDVTAGDPAGDLGDVLLLDPSGAALEAYADGAGRVDPALRLRARAWCARYAASMLANAHREDAALGSPRLVDLLERVARRAADGLAATADD